MQAPLLTSWQEPDNIDSRPHGRDDCENFRYSARKTDQLTCAELCPVSAADAKQAWHSHHPSSESIAEMAVLSSVIIKVLGAFAASAAAFAATFAHGAGVVGVRVAALTIQCFSTHGQAGYSNQVYVEIVRSSFANATRAWSALKLYTHSHCRALLQYKSRISRQNGMFLESNSPFDILRITHGAVGGSSLPPFLQNHWWQTTVP